MKVLEAVAASGGPVSNEHPRDPGMDPYPSTWNLSAMRWIEKKYNMIRVVFPQCMWGQTARKETCISGIVQGLSELDMMGNCRCSHSVHDVLCGKDEKGNFKTRKAQTYPPPLCEKLAELYVRTWLNLPLIGQWVNTEEFGESDEEEESQEDSYTVGQRVLSPEVARNWDPLDRWQEDARWVWKVEEHNNILEARAGLVSAKLATMQKANWGKRHLMISDSQVTIGVFRKGRSSTMTLNMIARKLAAITISTGCKFYWRYIRTHRNHADGPSRGAPLGVAPKSQDDMAQDLQLPDIFYQKTSG